MIAGERWPPVSSCTSPSRSIPPSSSRWWPARRVEPRFRFASTSSREAASTTGRSREVASGAHRLDADQAVQDQVSDRLRQRRRRRRRKRRWLVASQNFTGLKQFGVLVLLAHLF